MGNFSQSVFYFFVGELVALLFAIIVKNEKTRVWILVFGTLFSGILAFSLQGVASATPTTPFLHENPSATPRPMFTLVTTPTATNTRLDYILTPMTSVMPEPSTTPMEASQFLTQTADSNKRTIINLYIQQINFLGNVGDTGDFRLIVLVADTTGTSGGMFCPGDGPLKVRKGDVVISPCLFPLSFDEAKVSDSVYLTVMAIDETGSPPFADLSYETILSNLASAFGNAVLTGTVKIEAIGESKPYNFSIDALMNLVTGKVRTWLEKAEFVGVQGIYLSRQDQWSMDKSNTITSADAGIQITYRVVSSTSAP